MDKSNYTNLKTSKAISIDLSDKWEFKKIVPAYSFIDCLNVIEKIREKKGENIFWNYNTKKELFDALLADDKDMSKEGGEVEKLMISLINK